MSDHLLDKADALMHRRSSVADAATELTESIEISDGNDSEDFPLLTEVVADGQHQTPIVDETSAVPSETAITQQVSTTASEQIDRLLMQHQTLLAKELEIWLDEQMPQLVIRAMDGITDHLVSLLANRARDELLPRLESVMQRTTERKPGGTVQPPTSIDSTR